MKIFFRRKCSAQILMLKVTANQPLRILREQQQRAGNYRECTFARRVHVYRRTVLGNFVTYVMKQNVLEMCIQTLSKGQDETKMRQRLNVSKNVENDAQQLKGGQREGTWGFEKIQGVSFAIHCIVYNKFFENYPPPLFPSLSMILCYVESQYN